MSDKPISKGDLVMVVSAAKCCGLAKRLGYSFVVNKIVFRSYYCGNCGAPHSADWVVLLSENSGAPFYRLRRIDPPALNDDIPIGEELHV